MAPPATKSTKATSSSVGGVRRALWIIAIESTSVWDRLCRQVSQSATVSESEMPLTESRETTTACHRRTLTPLYTRKCSSGPYLRGARPMTVVVTDGAQAKQTASHTARRAVRQVAEDAGVWLARRTPRGVSFAGAEFTTPLHVARENHVSDAPGCDASLVKGACALLSEQPTQTALGIRSSLPGDVPEASILQPTGI